MHNIYENIFSSHFIHVMYILKKICMCVCVHMCMYMVICMYVCIAGDAHDLACLPLHELQHARLLCPLLSPRFCSNSHPLSW